MVAERKSLEGQVALVAGATRGAGRGIARMLGAAGATVYCTGRSGGGHGATPGRAETLEETAALVDEEGGIGRAIRVDHTVEAEVANLMERIRKEAGRLDILVNDIWGGDALIDWSKKFWEIDIALSFKIMSIRLPRCPALFKASYASPPVNPPSPTTTTTFSFPPFKSRAAAKPKP